jgi:hypothetical protein
MFKARLVLSPAARNSLCAGYENHQIREDDMVSHSLPELNAPLPSGVQHFAHAKGRAVVEAETVLAALKRVLENRIGTLEILDAIELT